MHKEEKTTTKKYTEVLFSKSQFPQGKAALIHHRSRGQRNNHFTTSHLTSRPLQNYRPQPLGHDCWRKDELVHTAFVNMLWCECTDSRVNSINDLAGVSL